MKLTSLRSLLVAGGMLVTFQLSTADTIAQTAPRAGTATAPRITAAPTAPAVANQAPASVPVATASAEDPKLKAEYDVVIEKFKQSQFADAVDALKKIYAARPNTKPPRIIMTELFAQANVAQAVPVSLEMAVQETPEDPEAYLLMAELQLNQRNTTAAELLIERGEQKLANYKVNAERHKNLQTKVYQDRITLCDARQQWELKQKYIMALIQHSGETSALVRALGVAYFQQKNDNNARELFVRADGIDVSKPADASQNGKPLPADAMMAQLYMQRGESVQKASASLDAALKAYPKSPEVLSLAVVMKLSENKLVEAQEMAEALYNTDPSSDNAKRLVAIVALHRGIDGGKSFYPVAERFFQELVTKSPSDSNAVDGLALALCEAVGNDGKAEQDKLKRAVEYAVGNVQRNQNNREYLATLGWVLFKAGQKQQAAEVLQRSCADGRVGQNAAYYIAELQLDADRVKNAESARNLLVAAVETQQPFLKRGEAQTLLSTLPPATASPTTTIQR